MAESVRFLIKYYRSLKIQHNGPRNFPTNPPIHNKYNNLLLLPKDARDSLISRQAL